MPELQPDRRRRAAEDGRYSFFVDATPVPFTRAVASPVNPVAIQ